MRWPRAWMPCREDNRLTCTQEGTLFLGVPEEDYFDRGDKLEAVWSLFRQAGVDARKEADILHRMWCKFMLNVGVNQVCMAYACGYGGVQAPGPARDTMIAAMNEAARSEPARGCWSPKRTCGSMWPFWIA